MDILNILASFEWFQNLDAVVSIYQCSSEEGATIGWANHSSNGNGICGYISWYLLGGEV